MRAYLFGCALLLLAGGFAQAQPYDGDEDRPPPPPPYFGGDRPPPPPRYDFDRPPPPPPFGYDRPRRFGDDGPPPFHYPPRRHRHCRFYEDDYGTHRECFVD